MVLGTTWHIPVVDNSSRATRDTTATSALVRDERVAETGALDIAGLMGDPGLEDRARAISAGTDSSGIMEVSMAPAAMEILAAHKDGVMDPTEETAATGLVEETPSSDGTAVKEVFPIA